MRREMVLGMLAGLIAIPLVVWAQGEPVGGRGGAPSRGYQGVVRASKEVVLTAPVSGILAELTVQEDEPVQSGQVVGRMDDDLQRVAVAAAKLRAESQTELLREKLVLEEATIVLERSEQAFASAAASEWEVRRARLQRDQAVAGVTAAEEALTLAKVDLEMEQQRLTRYRLAAPFDGRVFRIEVQQGATLAQSDRIMSLRVLDPLEAQLYVPVELYGKLQVGRTYRLMAAEPVNGPLDATLKTMDRDIDTASRTFRCVFSIANPDDALPPGFMVRLDWQP